MNEKLAPNNDAHDKFNPNTEENDYKDLITKLKKISITIDMLGKTISR